MNIFLVGYMANGKTYLGQRLAQKLDIPFYDLDQYIEERYKQSIPNIFSLEGEASFREKEAEALKSIPSSANGIISCGGGTFCFENNRKWIKEQGISIYLEVDIETLYNRLSGKAEERPIVKANNASKAELLTFLKTHLNSRKDDYEKADIVYSANGNVEEIIDELANFFYRFLKID